MVTIGELNEQFRAAVLTSKCVPVPQSFSAMFGGHDEAQLFDVVNLSAELLGYTFQSTANTDLDDGSVRVDIARMLYFGFHVIAALRTGEASVTLADSAETMTAFVDDDWIVETLEVLELDHLAFIDRPRTPRDVYPESVRLLRSDLIVKLASLTMLAKSH